MFKRKTKEDSIQEMTAPMSNNYIDLTELKKIYTTLYLNDDSTQRLETNLHFSQPQQAWKNATELQLRQNLSDNINYVMRPPQASEWNTYPGFHEWYISARKRARMFEVDYVDTFLGHCKLGMKMTNAKNFNQAKWCCIPFNFVSVGMLGNTYTVLYQLGMPSVKNGEQYIPTHVECLDLPDLLPRKQDDFATMYQGKFDFELDWSTGE